MYLNRKNEEILGIILGEPLNVVLDICEANDCCSRIVRQDENNYVKTADLRLDRVNIEVDNGIVTKCDIG